MQGIDAMLACTRRAINDPYRSDSEARLRQGRGGAKGTVTSGIQLRVHDALVGGGDSGGNRRPGTHVGSRQ